MSDTDSDIQKIILGAGYAFFGAIVGYLLSFIFRLTVARLYDPAIYGVFSLGLIILSLSVTFSSLGFLTGIKKFLSPFKSREKIISYMSSAIFIAFPLSIVISIFLFFFSEEISVSIFSSSDLIPFLKIFSLVLPLQIIYSLIARFFEGLEIVKYRVLIVNILKTGPAIIFVIILSFFDINAQNVAISYLLSAGVSVLVALYLYFRRIGIDYSFNPRYKEILSYSLPILFSGVIYLFLRRLDTLMIGYFMTDVDVGVYNAAVPLSNFLLVFLSSFIAIFFPVASRKFEDGEIIGLKEIQSITSKWILILTLPIAVFFVLFRSEVITLFFGTEYLAASSALAILSLGMLYEVFTGPLDMGLNAIEKEKKVLMVTCTALVSNVILNYFFIPIFGINGAALATSVSIIVQNSLGLYLLKEYFDFVPISKKTFKILLSIFTFVFIFLFIDFLIKNPYYILLTAIPLFIISYLFCLRVFDVFSDKDSIFFETIEEKTGIKTKRLQKILGIK